MLNLLAHAKCANPKKDEFDISEKGVCKHAKLEQKVVSMCCLELGYYDVRLTLGFSVERN